MKSCGVHIISTGVTQVFSLSTRGHHSQAQFRGMRSVTSSGERLESLNQICQFNRSAEVRNIVNLCRLFDKFQWIEVIKTRYFKKSFTS
jgi:hypothetical protein